MSPSVDPQRLAAAHSSVRSQLLAERSPNGSWEGELSSSPLAAATAISALVLAEQSSSSHGLPAFNPDEKPSHFDEIYRNDLSELLVQSLKWLAGQQNKDGGWGDTDQCTSNVATTLLVLAAFRLTGVPAKYQGLLERAEAYVAKLGGLTALKDRYENEKSFVASILTNCALADSLEWRKVPTLPFELALLPASLQGYAMRNYLSYSLPMFLAAGLAKFHHCPPGNPFVAKLRERAKAQSLALLAQLQPQSGGFFESTPLTSFVVMSLASIGHAEHSIVRRGNEFLLTSLRADGSWPLTTNMSVRNTARAAMALGWQFEEEADQALQEQGKTTLDWLLNGQSRRVEPCTGADPGGWAWTDLSGGVANADDTATVLLALAASYRRSPERTGKKLKPQVLAGIRWLLTLQNKDGGWPTFKRNREKLVFDRSATDVTAKVLRALHAWSSCLQFSTTNATLARRIGTASERGWRFLESRQSETGSWLPLWSGNQHHSEEANLVLGTTQVLTAYAETGRRNELPARRAMSWLASVQHASGGWGAVVSRSKFKSKKQKVVDIPCSIEETAQAVHALLPYRDEKEVETAIALGLNWLVETVDVGALEPAAVGFFSTKMWYHEVLSPLVESCHTLAAACRLRSVVPQPIGQ